MTTKYVCAFGRFRPSLAASARAAIFVAAALMSLLPTVAAAQANGQLQIHFIPVGQGDAALIISPLGETMLIDSGPYSASNCAGPTGIVTYLASIGLTRLDYHVASHYDADHIGCTDHVVTRWPIQRVAYDRGTANVPTTPTQTYTRYANSVSARRATVTVGQQIVLDAASSAPVVFHVAGVNGNGVSVSDENDRSVVLVLRFGWFDAEFGGDLPGFNVSGHRDLESPFAPTIGQVELYKVHHHGSASSSNPGFMATIRPKVAVLSMGSNNSYGHPTPQALDSIRSVSAITYWTTGGNGAPPQLGWDVIANGPVHVSVSPGATAFAVNAAGATTPFAMWEQPAPTAPDHAERDLAFDFGPSGVWLHSADAGWRQLHPLSPAEMASGDVDGNGQSDLILDFKGYGVWIWLNDSQWLQLHPSNAGQIVTADLDGNGRSAVLINFPGNGIWVWRYNVGWSQLNTRDPHTMAAGDLDGNGRADVLIDLPGFGVWVWMNNQSWSQLNVRNVTSMTVGDLDGNGRKDVLLDFPGAGIWIWGNNTSWAQLNTREASLMTTADLDGNGQAEAIIDFAGYGLWVWRNGSGWSQLHAQDAEALTPGDFDFNGRGDLVIDFGAAGLWVWWNNATWTQLHAQSPEGSQAGNFVRHQ